jgi:hypothetical protein
MRDLRNVVRVNYPHTDKTNEILSALVLISIYVLQSNIYYNLPFIPYRVVPSVCTVSLYVVAVWCS